MTHVLKAQVYHSFQLVNLIIFNVLYSLLNKMHGFAHTTNINPNNYTDITHVNISGAESILFD